MRNEPGTKDDVFTWIIAGVLAIAYAVFAHYASAASEVGAWAILLAAAPMIIIGFGFARESRWGVFASVLAVSACGGLVWMWPSLNNPLSWLYFVQHFSINAVLALIFGRTLTGGRRPLVTMLATPVHEVMTPELIRYTRQVTAAWTLFFLACATVSALLFFFASVEAWSVFANILSLPLIALMFLVENLVRKRILPKRDQLGLRATVRALRANFRP